MKILRSLPLSLLVISSLLAPLHAEVPAKNASPIAAAMEGFIKSNEIAGAVTLLSQNGKIVSFDATGYRDLESKTPMAKDDIFWIASMTKPITALGIMMLQDEGKLSINDPVEKHLPEFKGQMMIKEKTAEQTVLVKPKRPIIIKDLLMHVSGLVGRSPVMTGAYDSLTLKEAVISYALSPLQFEPGSKWSYCNPGIITLGRIIEVVSGTPYGTFLEKRLFKPLGMKDTTFWPNKKQVERIATSYKQKDDGKELEPTPIKFLSEPFTDKKRTAVPAGGLFSTAEDLFKLYSMVLNKGEYNGKRYLSEAAIKQMTTIEGEGVPVTFTPGNVMGLGFQVVRDPQAVTTHLSAGSIGHGGAYGTQGWIDFKKQAIHILLIHRSGLKTGDGHPMRQAFHDIGAGLLK